MAFISIISHLTTFRWSQFSKIQPFKSPMMKITFDVKSGTLIEAALSRCVEKHLPKRVCARRYIEKENEHKIVINN